MELKDIYQMWERMETSSVSELELEMHGVHLILKKDCGKKTEQNTKLSTIEMENKDVRT